GTLLLGLGFIAAAHPFGLGGDLLLPLLRLGGSWLAGPGTGLPLRAGCLLRLGLRQTLGPGCVALLAAELAGQLVELLYRLRLRRGGGRGGGLGLASLLGRFAHRLRRLPPRLRRLGRRKGLDLLGQLALPVLDLLQLGGRRGPLRGS